MNNLIQVFFQSEGRNQNVRKCDTYIAFLWRESGLLKLIILHFITKEVCND